MATPTKPKPSASSSSSDTPDPPRSDAEVRAEDQARVGVDGDGEARQHRAVSPGGVRVNRRAVADPEAKRAETRGRYRDPINDAIRIVGAGDVIPDGWERVESASLSDRGVEGARAAHASGKRLGGDDGTPSS